jgi:hypothetical protein
MQKSVSHVIKDQQLSLANDGTDVYANSKHITNYQDN